MPDIMAFEAEKEGVRSGLIIHAASRKYGVPISLTMPEICFGRNAVVDGFPEEDLNAEGHIHRPNLLPSRLFRGVDGQTLVSRDLLANDAIVYKFNREDAVLFQSPMEGPSLRPNVVGYPGNRPREGDRADRSTKSDARDPGFEPAIDALSITNVPAEVGPDTVTRLQNFFPNPRVLRLGHSDHRRLLRRVFAGHVVCPKFVRLFDDAPEELGHQSLVLVGGKEFGVDGVELIANFGGEGENGHVEGRNRRVNSFNEGEPSGLGKPLCFPSLYLARDLCNNVLKVKAFRSIKGNSDSTCHLRDESPVGVSLLMVRRAISKGTKPGSRGDIRVLGERLGLDKNINGIGGGGDNSKVGVLAPSEPEPPPPSRELLGGVDAVEPIQESMGLALGGLELQVPGMVNKMSPTRCVITVGSICPIFPLSGVGRNAGRAICASGFGSGSSYPMSRVSPPEVGIGLGIVAQERFRNSIGKTEENRENDAHKIYKGLNSGNDFKHREAYKILAREPRWANLRDDGLNHAVNIPRNVARRISDNSSPGNSVGSNNLSEDSDGPPTPQSVGPNSDLDGSLYEGGSRPIGQKLYRKSIASQKAMEGVTASGSGIHALLNELRLKKMQANQEKERRRAKTIQHWQAKIDLEQAKKNRKIMEKDLSTLSGHQLQYYLQRQAEIMERLANRGGPST
ncbi:hypothetical protein GIB67_039202 [Kingdonia uniflora]|uniref:No apical meristem-associated C-terminal domain-containing protein n=1 Tax=Kingdonia uniflora TaxID=39325 RepID=A0A7J7MLX9_9MAGN|nr:hypothetical protein GIB67_039202 [Kingdonia uniflora]